MRNVRIDDIDHVARAVIAIGTDYPPYVADVHSHRRAQLLYGATGVMCRHAARQLDRPAAARGVAAATMPHAVRMVGVTTRSLYWNRRVARRMPSRFARCRYPLMRQSLMAAVDMPLEYELVTRRGAGDVAAARAGPAATSCRCTSRCLPILGK